MLIIAKQLHQLDFHQLMQVYAEGNLENAQDQYPHLPLTQGIYEAEQDFYHYLRTAFFTVSGAYYAIWQEQGQYVSALRLEPYRDGLLLEAVETHPAHRQRGYGAALLRAVLVQLGQGKVYSHIARNNVPSIRLHSRCGFVKVLDYAVYIDGSINNYCETYCLEL